MWPLPGTDSLALQRTWSFFSSLTERPTCCCACVLPSPKAWPLSQLGIVSRQIPNGVSRVTRTTGLEDGSAVEEDVGHYRFSSDIEEKLENRAGSRNDIKDP